MSERTRTRTAHARSIALAAVYLALGACASLERAGDEGSTNGPLTPQQVTALGDEAARRGDFERALTYYLRGIGMEETADAWLRVAAASTELGNADRALVAYLKVLEHDALHVEAHEGAGLEYMALNDMDAARDHLIQAVELDPRRWRAHNALGILADQAGNHSAAMQHYEAAIDINPRSPMLLNNLGYSRYLAGDLDQAARDFYHVTQLAPDYKAAWSNLAIVYAHRGWYTDAVNILTRIKAKSHAYNDVGYIALRNGDWAQSEQLLSEAVRLSPTYYKTAHQNLEFVRAKRAEDGDAAVPVPLIGSNAPPHQVTRGDEG